MQNTVHPTNGENTPAEHLHFEDEGLIECDVCGITVPTRCGEFCYNAEIDMVYFTCNRCLEEEEGL